MDGHEDRAPALAWELLSDAIGGFSLVVLLLGALALPHLF